MQPAGSTDKRLLRSHLPPSKVDSLVSAHGMLAQRRRRRRQKDGHRSIFGLRMVGRLARGAGSGLLPRVCTVRCISPLHQRLAWWARQG